MDIDTLLDIMESSREEFDERMIDKFGADEPADIISFYLERAFEVLEKNVREGFELQ